MKDFLKVVRLCFLGLFSAVFIYPLLHESGHVIFALCSGAKPQDITFFPIPSVLCLMESQDTFSLVATGLGGMLFPALITLIPPSKNFAGWYVWFVIKCICLLSYFLALVSLFFSERNVSLREDDMSQIMNYAPQYIAVYYALVVFFLIVTLAHIKKTKPLDRCMAYFQH